MRFGIVGFFDMGESYGLDDEVFRPEYRAEAPDIGLVGINFPLGQGVLADLFGPVLDAWRTAAREQGRRPEMETGFSPALGVSRDEFDAELERLIAEHPVERCEVRVHAVGTAFTELRMHAGIPLGYRHGVLACFEFAAYTPGIAKRIHAAAAARVEAALLPHQRGLITLSKRDLPEVQVANDYEELPYFTGFTGLTLCIDDGDAADVAEVLAAVGIGADDAIEFEYHGKLHYNWASCVLEPKVLSDWEQAGEEAPGGQVMRMEADIRVAHVFLGACMAFTHLCTSEIHEQVGGYVGEANAGRSAQALNRLRTLALAVVNLTDFDQVAEAEEDRTYFNKFGADAAIERKHRTIQGATETLYNVQLAEHQEGDTKRQMNLSVIVGILTSLTLISVSADAYNFLRQEDQLIEDQTARALMLTLEVLLIVVLLAMLVTLIVRGPRRRV